MNSITLKIAKLTAKEFVQLCEDNRDLRMEREATGEIIIMPPTTPWTGQKNFDLSGQLWLWNRQTSLGIAFDSSTAFTLPNGAVRSPDASWVSSDRWHNLSIEEQQTFCQLAPDFVIELRSLSDSLTELRSKMQEYINNGVRLGWLIDPKNKTVEIYQLGQEVVVLNSPATVSGGDILPGFVLDLSTIW